jgi:hypothetical protein
MGHDFGGQDPYVIKKIALRFFDMSGVALKNSIFICVTFLPVLYSEQELCIG